MEENFQIPDSYAKAMAADMKSQIKLKEEQNRKRSLSICIKSDCNKKSTCGDFCFTHCNCNKNTT